MHGPCKRCCADNCDRVCAFVTGTFSTNNSRCATMDALRERVETHGATCWGETDQNLRVIAWGNEFIVMAMYKHRARTETAYIIGEHGQTRPLTITEAEAALAYLDGASSEYVPIDVQVKVETTASLQSAAKRSGG